jgi:hypothetical protein
MPGVFPEIGSGLVVMPSGSCCGLVITAELPLLALAFPVVSVAAPPQAARFKPKIKQNKTNKNFLNIKKILTE